MLQKTSFINRYQLHDRQDNQEHEEAVNPDFSPVYGSQPCGYERPHCTAHRQRYPQGSGHFTRVGEAQKTLQADDEQDESLHGISLPQVAAR